LPAWIGLRSLVDRQSAKEVKAVFARTRRRRATPVRSLTGKPAAVRRLPEPDSDPDAAAQVELIEETLARLDAVRNLIGELPELPCGDRQSLIAQLACTADSLRSLTFLDAIY
jgi:hypothetical protein